MKRKMIWSAAILATLLLLCFCATACGKLKPNDGVEDITIEAQMGE